MIINNRQVSICDCTLRDGGYYTNWDFPSEMVEKYLKAMNALPIDFVELGYRSLDASTYHGEYNYLPRYVLQKCKQLCPDKKLAFMINLKEVNEESIKPLLVQVSEYVAMVRLATRPEDVEKANRVAKIIKAYGLDVSINIMYFSTWVKDIPFAHFFQGTEQYVDFVVMVDSYGSVLPEQIGPCVEQLRANFKGKLGFHGHNNMELAFANTLAAIHAGVDSIDATISGMGRGAGNLRMELLLTYCTKYDVSVSLNTLMDTLEDFERLRKQYDWGTNLPYMISGCNSLPQKDIMEWITMKRYSTSSIVQRLQAHIQPHNVLEASYENVPIVEKGGKLALLIGGGSSVKEHIDAILELIQRDAASMQLVFSSTKHLSLFDSLPQEVERYIYLVGIEGKRLERQMKSLRSTDKVIIFKQALPMETYIPESIRSQVFTLPHDEQIDLGSIYVESPLYMSIKIAQNLHVSKMYLVGYDGYDSDVQGNTYNLMEENQSVIDYFKGSCDLCSLLPTKYRHIQEKSLYSMLAL